MTVMYFGLGYPHPDDPAQPRTGFTNLKSYVERVREISSLDSNWWVTEMHEGSLKRFAELDDGLFMWDDDFITRGVHGELRYWEDENRTVKMAEDLEDEGEVAEDSEGEEHVEEEVLGGTDTDDSDGSEASSDASD